MNYREKCLAYEVARNVFPRWNETHTRKYSCIIYVYDHNPRRPFSVIKRLVRVLQVVRCTPIVFNTSFASGPVFCSLIKL